MGSLLQLAAWFGGALFVAAIASRLLTDKQVPGILDNSITALANIFKGVFRG